MTQYLITEPEYATWLYKAYVAYLLEVMYYILSVVRWQSKYVMVRESRTKDHRTKDHWKCQPRTKDHPEKRPPGQKTTKVFFSLEKS